LFFLRPKRLRPWLSPRRPTAHKGDFGHVLVLAGSRGMTGAARLCAAGALRAGAGLVTLGVPKSQLPAAARVAPWEAMTLPLPENADGTFRETAFREVEKFVRRRKVTAVALGPGLRVRPGTARLVRKCVSGLEVPVVLDADGLNVLSAFGWPATRRAPLILTPHPGELARLTGRPVAPDVSSRLTAAGRLARQKEAVCVLKGHRTVVSDGRRGGVNTTGNPGMATGGTGDVLCGLIAALIAQTRGKDLKERMWRAALTGVYVHGLAGDLAARRKTRISLTAGDVLESLPDAFRKTFGPKI